MSDRFATDNERIAVTSSVLLLLAFVALMAGFAQRDEFTARPVATAAFTSALDTDPRMREINTRFEQAVAMLHAKQYDHAITALHRVIALSPNLVDAHVNMGYALLGLKRYKAAGDFFANAIRLDSYKANAYWGLAESLEGLGDKQAALGAMRTYIHLAPPGDPFVRKARSAMWEWENELKSGPLPKEDKAFIARGTKQWEERNSPDIDKPAPPAAAVDLLAPQGK